MLSSWLRRVAAYVEPFESISSQLRALYDLTATIAARGEQMSAEMDNLVREVAETRGVVNSAVNLIGTLAEKIEELKNDPVALQQLADDLNQQQQELAAAVEANTTPTTPEEPPVEPPQG